MSGTETLRAVQACYALDKPRVAWLESLADALAPFLDGGLGVGAWSYAMVNRDGAWNRKQESRAKEGAFPAGLRTEVAEALWRTAEEMAPSERVALVAASRVSSATVRLGWADGLDRNEKVAAFLAPLGVRDIAGITVLDATGMAVGVAAPQKRIVEMSRPTQQRLERIASHVLAGYRLRTALSVVDAVLSPDGETVHAEGDARTERARASLRDAVKAFDHAQSRQGAADPDEAVRAWAALVAGRWSIVEQFESDGRRYLVARRNAPGAHAAIPLTPLEAHSMLLRAQGVAYKAIRYELGLSEGTIHGYVRSGMRKLGLQNEMELARFFGVAAQALLGV